MALVQLLQPTDMAGLAGSSGFGGDQTGVSSFNILDPSRYISLTGSNFTYATNDVLDSGIIAAAAIDTVDSDLIPDVVFLNLSLHIDGVFGQDLFSDLFAAVGILMSGSDRVIGSAGVDNIFGFAGNDSISGGGGADNLAGGPGADHLDGGAGSDRADYASAPARVVADLLTGGTAGDAAGDTYVSIERLKGGSFSDVLRGTNHADIIGGGAGPGGDTLIGRGGNDTLDGGPGSDVIVGGAGKDLLAGSSSVEDANPDRFVFNALSESLPGANHDTIADFFHDDHDKIDLQHIDADTVHAGHQAFRFIGSDSFAHYHALHPGVLGMVRFAGGLVQANANANLGTDLEIHMVGVASMVAADFIFLAF